MSTGEALNQPQRLPENWGPIFGLNGFKDRLGDLSWLGSAYADQGWIEVGEELPVALTAEDINTTVTLMLTNTAWAVAVDNTSITRGQRADWIAFRQALQDIHLQPGFPTDIIWPTEPE